MFLIQLKSIDKYYKLDFLTEKKYIITSQQLRDILIKEVGFTEQQFGKFKNDLWFSQSKAVVVNPSELNWETCKIKNKSNPNSFMFDFINIRDESDVDPESLYSSNHFTDFFNQQHKNKVGVNNDF